MDPVIATRGAMTITRRAAGRSSRRGFTLVEVAVAASIASLVLAMVYVFWVGAATSTGKSVEHSDALRSALLASEIIRSNVQRVALVVPQRDLGILQTGTGFGAHLWDSLAEDMWSWRYHTETLDLTKVPDTEGVFQLSLTTPKGTSTIPGCLLGGLHFMLIEPGTVSASQGYLQITLVGLGNIKPAATFTSSALIPLTPWSPPAFYRMSKSPMARIP